MLPKLKEGQQKNVTFMPCDSAFLENNRRSEYGNGIVKTLGSRNTMKNMSREKAIGSPNLPEKESIL